MAAAQDNAESKPAEGSAVMDGTFAEFLGALHGVERIGRSTAMNIPAVAGGIEFIKPVPFEWAEFNPESDTEGNYTDWLDACFNAEKVYMRIIERGARPQEARTVLPLSTATVLYVTGMYKQWEDVLKLRLAPGAHPQMRYIMGKLVELKDFPKDRIHVPEAGK